MANSTIKMESAVRMYENNGYIRIEDDRTHLAIGINPDLRSLFTKKADGTYDYFTLTRASN